MSFVRVGRPRQLPKSKRPVCTKKAVAPKREWVSTVTDLSVHKLTPAELSRRHEIHKSHNKAAAQWELREKALRCRLRCAGSPAPLDQASLNIIREVFSDQLLLQDVLARSDKAMAVVKDLFGDAPRRQTGHPSVTMAPNCDSDSELPVLQRPDPPTQLSLLSQSMMDKQALNELEASEEDLSDEYIHPHGNSGYHVIRRDNIRRRKVKSRGGMKAHHANSDEADRDNVHVTPCTSGRAPDRTALNATVAVQRIQSKQNQSEEAKEEHSVLVSQVLNPDVSLNQSGRIHSCTNRTRNCVSQGSQLDGSSVASLSGNQSSLGQLQALLGQVEADLDTLSPDTAPGSAQSPEQHRTQGLTGFSVALVSTLGRLVHVLKQREEEAQKRAQEKRQLEEELREHRGLIDALTTETMILREEAATLQAVLQQQIAELEQKLDTVVLALGGFGLLEGHTDTPQDSDVEAAVCQSAPVPEQTRATVSPAVLLSPPQQRDNWQHILVADPVPLHQKHSPVDNCRSYKNFKCHSSTSSLTSLALTRLPSTSSLSLSSDPLSSQNPPEAILAEIAQLSRQNDSIRAQLSQVKVLGSGAEGSPNGGSEQRSLSSCSTGRITPQSDGERKTAGFSSTGRTSENIQVTERDKLTCQVTSPNTLNVSILEQHLLELNRQNAAARVKLLELIEQQKQSVMSKVPPSASPISQSASAAHAAVGGGSPEVSMLLPSQTDAGERRCADFQVPSSSFGEICDGKTQMEKQREQEGWFALSAHMRSKKSNN